MEAYLPVVLELLMYFLYWDCVLLETSNVVVQCL